MTQNNYQLEIVAEYPKATLYTIHLAGEELSELSKFLLQFPKGCKYDKEVDNILSWLRKIGQVGALERYFRPEYNPCDGLNAIPVDLGKKLRLYCIRVDKHTLIIGGGGIKDAKTWQKSPTLAQHVHLLIQVYEDIALGKFDNILKEAG